MYSTFIPSRRQKPQQPRDSTGFHPPKLVKVPKQIQKGRYPKVCLSEMYKDAEKTYRVWVQVEKVDAIEIQKKKVFGKGQKISLYVIVKTNNLPQCGVRTGTSFRSIQCLPPGEGSLNLQLLQILCADGGSSQIHWIGLRIGGDERSQGSSAREGCKSWGAQEDGESLEQTEPKQFSKLGFKGHIWCLVFRGRKRNCHRDFLDLFMVVLLTSIQIHSGPQLFDGVVAYSIPPRWLDNSQMSTTLLVRRLWLKNTISSFVLKWGAIVRITDKTYLLSLGLQSI